MHKYTRLNDEVELSNERFLDDVQSQQQVGQLVGFFVNFNAFTFIYDDFQSFINSFCADFAVCCVSHFSTK